MPLNGGVKAVAATEPRCNAFMRPCWLSPTEIKMTSLPGSKTPLAQHQSQGAVSRHAWARPGDDLAFQVLRGFDFRRG